MPIEAVYLAVCCRCGTRAPIDMAREVLPAGWFVPWGDRAQPATALILCGPCGDGFAAFMAAGRRPTA